MWRGSEHAVGSVHLPLSTLATTSPSSLAAPAASAPCGPAAVSIEGVSKTFQPAPPAVPHAQGARAAPVPHARPTTSCTPSTTSRVEIAAGRVLRHRRAQRQRQEHAAEVPRRHLRHRHRRAARSRPAVAVHRARRRLQPGPDRARQRDDQRDHARAHAAARRGRASTRSSPSPSSRSSSTCELKNYSSGMLVRLAFSVAIQVDAEILLIDEVLAVGDARLPAEVLRRVPPAQARGPHDPVRHPRHERRRALLRPRDAAGQRADGRRSANPRAIARALQQAQLRPAIHATTRAPAEDRTRLPRRRRSSTPGSRTPAASASPAIGHRGHAASRASRSASTRTSTIPIFGGDPAQRASAPRSFATTTALEHGRDSGSFRAGETAIVRLALRDWLTPRPLHADPLARARRARARTRSTCRGHDLVVGRSSTAGNFSRPSVVDRARTRHGVEMRDGGEHQPDVGLPAPPRAPGSHRVHGPIALRRRPAALLNLTFTLATHRIQAAATSARCSATCGR